MSLKLLASLPLAAVVGGSAAIPPESVEEVSAFHRELFNEFSTTFGRAYDTEEEQVMRRAVFIENLKEIERMSRLDESAVYSHLTPFADWTNEEFAAYNTLDVSGWVLEDARLDEWRETDDLPSSFDWREHGAVNPIKDQGRCGSCWAFSTVANIEGVNFIHGSGELLSLSEQQLVSCSASGNHGCFGGLQSQAFEDMIKNEYGLETEEDYPYHPIMSYVVPWMRGCKAEQDKMKVGISGWKQISEDEDQIAAALMEYGPLAIAVDSRAMKNYKSGVADPPNCRMRMDHAITITGFGEMDGKQFWSIRNSWGESWGDNGYWNLVRGKGACLMNKMVVTSMMSDGAQEQSINV